MNLALSEEHSTFAQLARDFAARSLAPKAAERDVTGEFPSAELAEAGRLGLLAIAVPDELGGSGMDSVATSLALSELSAVDASVSVAVSVTNMVAELIAAVAPTAQAMQWVPALANGSAIAGAFALSEVSAGSDPAGMQTRAEKTATGFRLFGTKQWITSGDRAGVMVVWAVTDRAAGHKGLTAFLVRGGAPGLSVSRLEEKMGLHGSSTAQLVLDGVEVSDHDVLGGVGGGFALAMRALDGGRIGIASQAVGIARGALTAAVQYAKERQQFGVPIISHQGVAAQLADAATWLDAAQLLTWRAAAEKSAGRPFGLHAAKAKLYASEQAGKICDIALQVHGGYGYTRDFPIERAVRDVRVTRIYEGTSEIQRIVIARGVLAQIGQQ